MARYVESAIRRAPDVAAGFQESVADVLTMKAVRAATDVGVDTLLLGGGAPPTRGFGRWPKSVAPQPG